MECRLRGGQQEEEEEEAEGKGEGPAALAEGRPVSCRQRQNPVGLKHNLSVMQQHILIHLTKRTTWLRHPHFPSPPDLAAVNSEEERTKQSLLCYHNTNDTSELLTLTLSGKQLISGIFLSETVWESSAASLLLLLPTDQRPKCVMKQYFCIGATVQLDLKSNLLSRASHPSRPATVVVDWRLPAERQQSVRAGRRGAGPPPVRLWEKCCGETHQIKWL